MNQPSIALVTTPTRLQGLLSRWGTKGAAKFRINQALQVARSQFPTADTSSTTSTLTEAEFTQYESEDQIYRNQLAMVRQEIDCGHPVTVVERRYLSNFDFRNVVAVVVLGPDGLVANTAKYTGGLPIIGVNPDPSRYDGILVPFQSFQVRRVLQATLKDAAPRRSITLAQATLNDNQSLLGFNDLFIGRRTHVSARYTLQVDGLSEAQSSSGMIVATGAGSTGWLSSIFNMFRGVASWTGGEAGENVQLRWEDRRLAWVVREPFASKQSQASLVAGTIEEGKELVLESLMPDSGVIFSDGVEQDFLEFNSGTIARIGVAEQRASLVIPTS